MIEREASTNRVPRGPAAQVGLTADAERPFSPSRFGLRRKLGDRTVTQALYDCVFWRDSPLRFEMTALESGRRGPGWLPRRWASLPCRLKMEVPIGL